VPYKNTCCPEGYENAPLFLDCCGLVRRAQRDLQREFGFKLAQGNQSYQFDTLPDVRSSSEELKPGDLIFYSAIFQDNEKSMIHDMTHVEIFSGKGPYGEGTIGSRRGKVVSEHDTYKFPGDKSVRDDGTVVYHSVKYHFRSIDAWLHGHCRSFCPEHKWDFQQSKLEMLYGWTATDILNHTSKSGRRSSSSLRLCRSVSPKPSAADDEMPLPATQAIQATS